ncbi:hypothetical protein C8R47DRAFT_1151050 [Mycena vitilis]|nr:hypothetical protein C8R47DRAFT_1151050 [Mycena vitilis]
MISVIFKIFLFIMDPQSTSSVPPCPSRCLTRKPPENYCRFFKRTSLEMHGLCRHWSASQRLSQRRSRCQPQLGTPQYLLHSPSRWHFVTWLRRNRIQSRLISHPCFHPSTSLPPLMSPLEGIP